MAQSKYETVVDLGNKNTTYWHIADMIGSGKRVLDVGCDTGYFGRVLIERGNRVSGVEYVESSAALAREHLESVLVADLENVDLAAELGTGQFDFVIFADVLEHLRDPVPVLRSTRRLLAPGGSVLISVPNVAHGDLRLALLHGRWDYTPIGLLDKTHTRFFTRESLTSFLADAGFVLADLRRTRARLFETEQEIRREDYPTDVVQAIEADPESTTYQFVLRAVPDDSGVIAADLANRCHDLQLKVDALEDALRAKEDALAAARDRLAAAEEAADANPPPSPPPPTIRAVLGARFPRGARFYRYLRPWRKG